MGQEMVEDFVGAILWKLCQLQTLQTSAQLLNLLTLGKVALTIENAKSYQRILFTVMICVNLV